MKKTTSIKNAIRLSLIAALTLFFTTSVGAHGIEEFDTGSGIWKPSPKKISRTTLPGWEVVAHNGDNSFVNNPATTRYTYYWKLTRTYDLTNSEDPQLDIKFDFLAGDYSLFAVQIGDQHARKASDFTTLQDYTEPTVEEGYYSLASYAGQVVKIRLLLKKRSGVVVTTPGLYLQRIGIEFPQVTIEVDDDPDSLLVGAFNVQVFGKSKMNKPEVPENLVTILSRYDLVLFQEIRDTSGQAFPMLMERLNAATGGQYDMTISDKLGRTSSKEQYAYIYKTAKLSVLDSYHYDDGVEPDQDTFQREPYIVRFQSSQHDVNFSLIGIHTSPEHAREEIDALTLVHDDAVTRLGDEDVLILGDFNASCNYVRASHFDQISLRTDSRFQWHISDAADTTTGRTVCAYDRFVTTSGLTARVESGSVQVFYFDQALNLTPKLTKRISDHYPVELRLNLAQ